VKTIKSAQIFNEECDVMIFNFILHMLMTSESVTIFYILKEMHLKKMQSGWPHRFIPLIWPGKSLAKVKRLIKIFKGNI